MSDPRFCTLCQASPCQLIGAPMAPRSEARALASRDRARNLLKAWEAVHVDRLATKPLVVRAELRDVAWQEARELVRRGDFNQIRLTAEQIEKMYRRLVTQIRRQRHGNVEDVSTEQWAAQCTAIASELGYAWQQVKQEKAA